MLRNPNDFNNLVPIWVQEKLKLESIPCAYSIPLKSARSPEARAYLRKKGSIYLFIDIGRGNVYIGSAADTTKRLGEHFNPIVENRIGVSNVRFQNALAKYGIESFVLVISEFIIQLKKEDSKDFTKRLLAREQFHLDLVPFSFQYNIARTAGSKGGCIASPETRQKMSAASKGVPKSDAMRAALSASTKGVPKTLEGRANMSVGHLKMPPERRAVLVANLVKLRGSPVRLSNEERGLTFESPSLRQALPMLELFGTKTVLSTIQAYSTTKKDKLFKGWKVELLPKTTLNDDLIV